MEIDYLQGGFVTTTASLLGFITASLVVLLLPGPGVLYVVARSLSQGQRAGLASAAGLSTGALVQVAAATAGLSAILLTSASAFGLVKMLGAGYLVYLGVRAFIEKEREAEGNTELSSLRSTRRLFTDGIVVSVLNPKIAIFFLAFLPQFVDPSRGPIARQVLFLGLVYVLLALLTDSAYAVLASRMRRVLGSRVMRGPIPRYGSGSVYLGLGVSTALAERP